VAKNPKTSTQDKVENLEKAHEHSSLHREEVESSDLCGCFYCLEIYAPDEISEWVDEGSDGIRRTALCPKCGIDSVIASSSGLPIDHEFLEAMRRRWFDQFIPSSKI